jgi:hypothetical protein
MDQTLSWTLEMHYWKESVMLPFLSRLGNRWTRDPEPRHSVEGWNPDLSLAPSSQMCLFYKM